MGTISVELLGRVSHRGGGLLHAGEVAAFEPGVAQDLVRRGLARPLEGGLSYPALEDPMDEVKAISAPPADKMVGGHSKGRESTPRKK